MHETFYFEIKVTVCSPKMIMLVYMSKSTHYDQQISQCKLQKFLLNLQNHSSILIITHLVNSYMLDVYVEFHLPSNFLTLVIAPDKSYCNK